MPSGRLPFVDISVFMLIFSLCLGAVNGAMSSQVIIAGESAYIFGQNFTSLIVPPDNDTIISRVNSSYSSSIEEYNSSAGSSTFWAGNLLGLVNWVIAAFNMVANVAVACLALGTYLCYMFPWLPWQFGIVINVAMLISYGLGIAQFMSNRNLRS